MIITGATTGTGRACALGFARDGAAVAVVDRNPEAVHALAQAIANLGCQVIAVVADVAQEGDAARVATETVAELGGIDILVTSAGSEQHGTAESTTLEIWNATIAANLTSVFLLAHYTIPEMRRRGGGAIVHVASLHGLVAEPNVAAHAASAGGVLALTRTMALDYAAEGIRVNSVCPGAIDTPALRGAARLASAGRAEDVLRQWGAMQPVGRLGTPEEVAELVLFLAGSRASFITGCNYVVDGGLSARF